ncbi:MAG: apolipoprotein N-acyltransferase [Pyrinomonadaceae bacterium]|nr:apolipoprotein N-acyltransferase [Pyrinomonadaceae bacterium]
MENAFPFASRANTRRGKLTSLLRASAPTLTEGAFAALSVLMLVCSFPDFDLWPLAWVGFVPLIYVVCRRPHEGKAFLLGLVAGALFFWASCYWLTYSMIRYGGIPTLIAYLILLPGALVLGLFPATCLLMLARCVKKCGIGRALLVLPFAWAACEWARLGVTGQLWNAIGYSQAYVVPLIQTARWGGVYLVSFFILAVNSVVAYAILARSKQSLLIAVLILSIVATILFLSAMRPLQQIATNAPSAIVIAVQPNVPMEQGRTAEEDAVLVNRHLTLSERALQENINQQLPRLIVWPESPMYFSYARDSQFREMVARFAARNETSLLFNSNEPAPTGGSYNSAVMINSQGRLVAQYDKIRLLPFGEYVPLPRWLPGAGLVSAMVGDFTPGAVYTLLPVGEARTGVFICFESAFPSVARSFAQAGVDVLINVSNDGYLGRTPVLRQHLANTVFRAVENRRPVLRVTNTGITAHISARGEVTDATGSFETATRTWTISRSTEGTTFYTKHGDLFAALCGAISFIALASTFRRSQLRRAATS